MKNVLESKILRGFIGIVKEMYSHGWDERNGGNVSYILDDGFDREYNLFVKKVIPFDFDAKKLSGKLLLVTGTGKYFRNISNYPENDLGIIRISSDGCHAELLWGFNDGGSFTSELPSHLMSHIERLQIDSNHRVIMHCHPTNLLALTFVHTLDEREFTRTLWRMCTECMMVFPDGISVLPWMVCGTKEIGIATAEKMKKTRLTVWGQHGIYAAGKSLDEAFGLIETAEKAAEVYLKISDKKIINTISDDGLREIAKRFDLTPRKEFLDNNQQKKD